MLSVDTRVDYAKIKAVTAVADCTQQKPIRQAAYKLSCYDTGSHSHGPELHKGAM